jgi:hypothetical protein
MILVLKYVARLGLVLTILPSILVLMDSMTLANAKWMMILGTVLWLGLAPFIQKSHNQ